MNDTKVVDQIRIDIYSTKIQSLVDEHNKANVQYNNLKVEMQKIELRNAELRGKIEALQELIAEESGVPIGATPVPDEVPSGPVPEASNNGKAEESNGSGSENSSESG